MEAEVKIANNGFVYQIVDEENRKVKKVGTLKKFQPNTTLEALSEEQELENTRTLFRLLKDNLGQEVTMSSSGVVKYNGFKMWYDNYGFKIVDAIEKKELNINDYNNDLPYPKDVLRFLKEIKERPQPTIEPKEEERLRVIDKLSEKFIVRKDNKVVVEKVVPREVKLENKKKAEAETLENRRKTRVTNAVNRLLEAAKEGKKVSELKEMAKKVSQKRDNLKTMHSAITAFKKKTITYRSLSAKIRGIAKEVVEKPRVERPVFAPKFTGLTVNYEPRNLVVEDGVMKFAQKDELGKRENLAMPVLHYLINQVLYHYPKAMELLMKTAEGVEFDLEDLDYHRFIKDRTIAYDHTVIHNPSSPELMEKVCREILWRNYHPVALDNLYSEDFKRGDRVKVLYRDLRGWFTGTVVSTETGVKVQYDDGDLEIVQKHMEIAKI